MKRTEIPAVKMWGDTDIHTDSTLDPKWCSPTKANLSTIPCILRTAAADKLILDVVRQVMTGKDSMWDKRVNDAVQRLEKAGVKL